MGDIFQILGEFVFVVLCARFAWSIPDRVR